jgi:hypothetical protein
MLVLNKVMGRTVMFCNDSVDKGTQEGNKGGEGG